MGITIIYIIVAIMNFDIIFMKYLTFLLIKKKKNCTRKFFDHESYFFVKNLSNSSFSGNPGEQEILVGKLHYREVHLALSILQNGGSFVLKLFTMFESDTICLMYLLCCVFQHVNLFKPASSKEVCNCCNKSGLNNASSKRGM